MRHKRIRLWTGVTVGVATALIAATLPAGTAVAGPSRNGCEARNNNTPAKLLECVTPEGVERHLDKFAAIAKANKDPDFPGSRASGTQGYADSVAYVAGQLRKAGYQVTEAPFEITSQPAQLRQLTPTEADRATGAFWGSSDGEVTGRVVPVALNLADPEASTSACVPADFGGLDFSGAADIALIQRGGCNYWDKVRNAQTAGAEAVVVLNQGTPDQMHLEPGALVDDEGNRHFADIPVVGVSFGDGEALSAPGATAHITVTSESRTDINVIADLPGKNRGNVVMAGAHLDSTGISPGINDNGSGAAALLETALLMANHKPQNSLRFAFWGAEELGLWGSSSYVLELADRHPDELARIALYLNYDMVASPNYVFGIRDGDGSTAPPPEGFVLPPGSAAIEKVYEDYFTRVGIPFTAAPLDGRSDYLGFLASGIPAGGLFTGAEMIKTEEEAAIWGGQAGQPYDACYHQPCDTRGNINRRALAVNSDAMAYANLSFAYSTEAVNNVRGAKIPGNEKLPMPDGRDGHKKPGKKHHDKSYKKHDKERERMRKRHEAARTKVEAQFGRLRIPGKVADNRPGHRAAPRAIS